MLTVLLVILIGIALAPLSCLMLWGRYINFTDSLMHACIFGALIHQILQIDIGLSILISGFLVWIISIFLQIDPRMKNNNANVLYLTSMFMSSLAIASNTQYLHLLFGNILFVSLSEIIITLCIIAVIFLYIYKYKNEIVLTNINQTLARNVGIKAALIQNTTLLIIICSVSFFVKIMGGGFFIIAAMMLPGMISFHWSNNPTQMIKIACLIAAVNNACAVLISELFDIAFAPLTIIIGFIMYIFTIILQMLKRSYN